MKNNFPVIRWLYGCLIFFTASCGDHTTSLPAGADIDPVVYRQHIIRTLVRIDSLQNLIESGDVVTRTGSDFTSESLRSLNRKDKTFSHCGIASIENDSVFIYHALGGEWNPDELIRREPFRNFAEPYNNKATGIFRPSLTAAQKEKLLATVKKLRQGHTKFDMDFDLKTDDRMYCAEFVYKSFIAATDSAVQFHHSFIRQFEFIGVDDITGNPLFKKIYVVKYRLYN